MKRKDIRQHQLRPYPQITGGFTGYESFGGGNSFFDEN